jgi:hypothetical protein
MYQRFPGDNQSSVPSPAGNVPQSVRRAAQVMYVGVATSLIGIVIELTTLSSARNAIRQHSPNLTTAQVNNAVHVEIGVFIAGGLIGAALWLWMAQSCLAGKGWARVVSTVFFGIDTLGVLFGASSALGAGAARFYSLVVWVVGLIAIILLWRRSSSDYFRAPRY